MQLPLRPWVTASVALTGAAFLAVPPTAPPLPEVQAQHRAVALKSYDEFDFSQLASTTTTNIDALESYFSSNPFLTSPDVEQGFSTLLTDIFTGQSNPVTNPISVLAEGGLGLLSSGYGFNAASSAFTGVIDNVQAALSSDNYSAALTDLENGPTTVLYAALNGYPESVGNGLLSPEFGLLTSPAGDGLATGSLYAVNQIETTLANELSALGGGNLTTGSLPEVTGNVDLTVSVDQALNDILNALGFTSGGDVLTVNGLLTDLGVDPTANLLPSVDIGEVLNLLGLSDTSGISLGSILTDLGLSDTSGISLGSILTDLGLSDTSTIPLPAISVGTILGDLGLSDTSSISIPAISVGTILGDLGLSTSSDISLPAISVSTILSDLGVNTGGSIDFSVPSISLGTVLSDLGINTGSTITLSTLITDLVGNPSYLGISLSSFLNDVKVGSDAISIASILGVLGINTGSTITPPEISVSVSTLLNDLGINPNSSITPPDINLGTVLGDLGINTNTTITPPDLNLGEVLGFLGLTDSSTITPPDINIGEVLSTLGLNDTNTITLGEVLSTLGLNDTNIITLGDVLGTLGFNDTTTIPLPSFSLDNVLTDLGINPNASIDAILTQLGIPDTLTLSPSLDLTGGPVPEYFLNLSQDLLAAIGSIQSLSSDLPSLLTTDPTLALTPLLADLVGDLGLPFSVTGGDLAANLTNVLAEVLPTLF